MHRPAARVHPRRGDLVRRARRRGLDGRREGGGEGPRVEEGLRRPRGGRPPRPLRRVATPSDPRTATRRPAQLVPVDRGDDLAVAHDLPDPGPLGLAVRLPGHLLDHVDRLEPHEVPGDERRIPRAGSPPPRGWRRGRDRRARAARLSGGVNPVASTSNGTRNFGVPLGPPDARTDAVGSAVERRGRPRRHDVRRGVGDHHDRGPGWDPEERIGRTLRPSPEGSGRVILVTLVPSGRVHSNAWVQPRRVSARTWR